MLPVGTNLELKKLPSATLAVIGINICVFAVKPMLAPRSFGVDDHQKFYDKYITHRS